MPQPACRDARINPIALRKAKIVYKFGIFECKRVKLQLPYKFRDKIFTIAASQSYRIYICVTGLTLHLTILHSEWPELYRVLAILSAVVSK